MIEEEGGLLAGWLVDISMVGGEVVLLAYLLIDVDEKVDLTSFKSVSRKCS